MSKEELDELEKNYDIVSGQCQRCIKEIYLIIDRDKEKNNITEEDYKRYNSDINKVIIDLSATKNFFDKVREGNKDFVKEVSTLKDSCIKTAKESYGILFLITEELKKRSFKFYLT